MYRLLLTNPARKDLDRLPGSTFERVSEALQSLKATPRPPGCVKLRDDPAYRIRIGDYRAIYDIDDEAQSVTVLRVKHRREVYRDL